MTADCTDDSDAPAVESGLFLVGVFGVFRGSRLIASDVQT
jgi:hypothetical protein